MSRDVENKSIPSEMEEKTFPQNTVGALATEEVRKFREKAKLEEETKLAKKAPALKLTERQSSEGNSFGENGLSIRPMEMVRTDYPPGSFAGPVDPFSVLLMQILGQMSAPRRPRRPLNIDGSVSSPSPVSIRSPHPFMPRGLIPFGPRAPSRPSLSPILSHRLDFPDLMQELFEGPPGIQSPSQLLPDLDASEDETIVIFFRPINDDSESGGGFSAPPALTRGRFARHSPISSPRFERPRGSRSRAQSIRGQNQRVTSKASAEDPAQAMMSILNLLDEIVNDSGRGRGRGRARGQSRGRRSGGNRKRHFRGMH